LRPGCSRIPLAANYPGSLEIKKSRAADTFVRLHGAPHKFMKTRQSLLIALLFFAALVTLPATASAKDEWIRVHSKNFNLIGNASEKDIRKVATRLEQFRETFRLLFSKMNLTSPIGTNVVVFKSENAYKPFKPKMANGKADTGIAGYFQPGDDVNYITLSTEGDDAETFVTIFHEYVHFIVDTNFGKTNVPTWFNEGLAEYYSTFAIDDDQKVKLGLPRNDHLYNLQNTPLIPLRTLFNVSNFELHANGDHSRGIFYSEAWALMHYFLQGGKAQGFSKFLNLLLNKTEPEAAFQDAFQMSYATGEKELAAYVKKNKFNYQLITFTKKLVFDNEMQTTVLSDAESSAYLGDLLYHSDRLDEAEPLLQKALAADSNSVMANTSLGMVKMRRKKYSDARTYLEKAVLAEQKNHQALYAYAYVLATEDEDESGSVSKFTPEKLAKIRDLLKRAIAANPGFGESYDLLGFVSLVSNEGLDEAAASLQTALKVQPGNQRVALRLGEIFLRQKKYAESTELATRVAAAADDRGIKALADSLVSRVIQARENDNARAAYEKAAADSRSRPTITRRAAAGKQLTAEERAKEAEDASIRSINESMRKAAADEKRVIGQIQRIDCKGKAIIFTVKSGVETITLSGTDFQSLALSAFTPEANQAEMGCGADFAALNAVITYRAAVNSGGSAKGELIAVEFVPKNFRIMDAGEQAGIPILATDVDGTDVNSEAGKRKAMMAAIKGSMRKVMPGEKQAIGTIEKTECDASGVLFTFKTANGIINAASPSPQAIRITGYTPEIKNVKFGCGMSPVDVPVVFTYQDKPDPKANSAGLLMALEFVPKSFALDDHP
jgi:tetratricopeptide (TPR) repeat protein